MTGPRLIGVAAVLVLLAVADWITLEVGLLKPWVLGAGSLQVESSAEGAEVLLDGRLLGTTPLRVDTVLAGRRHLQVRHRFHPPLVAPIEIERGETRRMSVDLPPAYGQLLVASNPVGATVTLNGRRQATPTPLEIERMPTGRHQVELIQLGRGTVRKAVEVLPDQRAELIVELARVAMGALRVRPKPSSARVRLRDAPLPYAPGVRLPVGVYEIEVSAPGYASKTRSHRLRQGENLVEVTLQRMQGALVVNATPKDAEVSVRVPGSDAGFSPHRSGAELPTGELEVRVRKGGYRTEMARLQLPASGKTLNVALTPHQLRGGEALQDALASGGAAPALLVVPAGRVRIGVAEGSKINALPAEEVVLDDPFAISVNEVTLGDYGRYAQAMGLTVPKVKGMDSERHPIVKISWREAADYSRWLSEETGQLYRLPTEREWAYVAVGWAASGPSCQRGNIADQSLRRVFRVWRSEDCDDGFVRSAPVRSFQANRLGIHDLFGNVAEWVQDCGLSGCASHVARGSAWDSSGDELKPWFRESYSIPSDTRGFRVVREL